MICDAPYGRAKHPSATGTTVGYRRHLAAGESACEACVRAAQEDRARKSERHNAANEKWRAKNPEYFKKWGREHPEYGSWKNMIARCRDVRHVSYPRWGGRGIEVCDRWADSLEDFIADMGPKPSPRHSIDRIGNDGNYEPGNCRWATSVEQRANRRPTTSRIPDAVIHRITTEHEAGLNFAEIARRLNEDGVPTPRGAGWSRVTTRSCFVRARLLNTSPSD